MTVKLPCLIVETSRAGRWNHCLIVSGGMPIDLATAVQYTTMARKCDQGHDYIMVSHKVMQPTTGREGDELLILAGIDARQLSEQEITELKNSLRGLLLEELEELVVKKIKWDEDKQPSIIERPELSDWLHRLALPQGHRVGQKPFSKRVLVPFVVLLAILCASGLWAFRSWDKSAPLQGISGKEERRHALILHDDPLGLDLKSWSVDFGLEEPGDDQKSEAICQKIVQALEAKLVLEGKSSKTPQPILVRFEQLLDDFNRIDPIDPKNKTGANDKLVSNVSFRRRVKQCYDDKDRSYSYLNLKDREGAKERLTRSDVALFRKLIGHAHAFVKRANELGSVPDDSQGDMLVEILIEIKKMEGSPRDVFNRVRLLRWSFFVPDDLDAMEQFTSLTTAVAKAKVFEKDAPAPMSFSKGDSEAALRQFIGLKDKISGAKAGAAQKSRDREFYEGLLTLIEDTEKYLPTSPKSGAKEEKKPE